jgi:hypothetical protein
MIFVFTKMGDVEPNPTTTTNNKVMDSLIISSQLCIVNCFKLKIPKYNIVLCSVSVNRILLGSSHVQILSQW